MKYGLFAFVVAALIMANAAAAYPEAGIDINMDKNTVCPCSTLSNADFEVLVTNLDSEAQEYLLGMVLPDDELWSGFIVPNVTLGAGESAAAAAFITPSCSVKPGIYQIGFVATSPLSGKTTIKNVEIEVMKCRWVDVATGDYEICGDEKTDVDVAVKNEGEKDERVKIEANAGWVTFDEDVFDIAAGEEKTIQMSFDPPEGMVGVEDIELSVDSLISYAKSTENMRVSVDECYSTSFDIMGLDEPDASRVDVCPCETASFSLEINNTGLVEDEYTIRYGGESDVMVLSPGSSGVVNINVDVPCDKEAGEYPIEIGIDSHDPASTVVTVGVMPEDTCYSVYLYSDYAVNVKDVNVGESETYEVVAINKGRYHQDYKLLIDSPSWVYMSDSEAPLDSGEEKVFYVYAAPEYETSPGSYPVTVSAVSDKDQASIEFEVVAVSNFTLTEEDHASSGANTGVTEDTGMEPEGGIPTTGMVIEDVTDKPWTQIVLISILAIAVVFVLILRFIVMMK